MRALAVLALASLMPCFAPAQTSAAPSPSPSPAAPGSTGAMTTYHNDALHLSYSYPSAYTDASAMVGPAFEASMGSQAGKDAARCVTLPFSAMSNANNQLAMVLIVRADAGCMNRPFTAAQLPEFTRGEIQGLSASGATTHFGDPVPFTAVGHPAQLLRGSFQLPTGQSLHAMVACVLLNPDVACFQFLSSTEETLRTMSAFPLTLEGGQPEPLIPPAVLQKQK